MCFVNGFSENEYMFFVNKCFIDFVLYCINIYVMFSFFKSSMNINDLIKSTRHALGIKDMKPFFSELCRGKAVVAYAKPQQSKE